MDDDKRVYVMKVMKTPTVYETVDEVLESNIKWKNEQIKKYKADLKFLKDTYEEVISGYQTIMDTDGATKNEMHQVELRLTKLKLKIIKLEQLIQDYEKRPW